MSGNGQRDGEVTQGDLGLDAVAQYTLEALVRSTVPPVVNPVRLRQSFVKVNGTLMFLVLMNGRMSRLQEAAELKSVKSLYPTLLDQPEELEICFVTGASPVGAAFNAFPEGADTMNSCDPIVLTLKIETP